MARNRAAYTRPILENHKIQKIGRNIKCDILAMKQAAIHIQGVALDTSIAAFVFDSSRTQHRIDRLALDYLQFKKVPTSDLIGTG